MKWNTISSGEVIWKIFLNNLLMRMGFTVCPHAHAIRSSKEWANEVLPMDVGLFSGDFSLFSYYGCVVMVDPFVVLACGCVGVGGGGGGGVGEACAEVLGGYNAYPDVLIGIISVAISCCWTVVQ